MERTKPNTLINIGLDGLSNQYYYLLVVPLYFPHSWPTCMKYIGAHECYTPQLVLATDTCRLFIMTLQFDCVYRNSAKNPKAEFVWVPLI